MSVIQTFRMGSSVGDLPAYNLILSVIDSYSGDVEKFYTNCYNVFVNPEDSYRELERNCTRLLGFETRNHILTHIKKLW